MFESHDLSPKKNRSSYCVWLKWLVFIIHPFYRSSSLTTSCFISVCPGVLFEYLLSLLLIFTLVFEFQPLSFLIWIIYGLLIRVFPGGPTEKAMATHSSTLAWKIPWMEEPGRLQSMGSLRVGHNWATLLSLFTFMHWRGKWQPTPVFLPGESQGCGSLVGCRLWGRTE